MRSVNVPPTSTPSRFIGPPRLEDDLPEVFAPLHHGHRLARLLEREHLVDERLDGAALRELDAPLELVAVVDEGADDALLAAEERDDVEGHDLARVSAAGHEPAVLAERVERVLEEVSTDVLVGEVDSLVVRQPHDLGNDVLLGVVDAVVHAQLGCPLELLVRCSPFR